MPTKFFLLISLSFGPGAASFVCAADDKPNLEMPAADALVKQSNPRSRRDQRRQRHSLLQLSTNVRWHTRSLRNYDGQLFAQQNYSGREFRACSFQRASFVQIDFAGADLRESDFSQASFAGADFSGALADRALFRSSKMQGARAARLHCEMCDFQNANLIGADFTAAYLVGADLRGADLREAAWAAARLESAVYDASTKLPFDAETAKKLGMQRSEK